jgi:Cu/Ag efflux protein CusF
MRKMHSLCVATLTVLASCGAVLANELSRPIIVAQAEAAKIFHGVGTITGIDSASGSLTINHAAIPGLMEAMEMSYETKPAKLLEGLKIGDKVDFALDGKSLTILEVSQHAH